MCNLRSPCLRLSVLAAGFLFVAGAGAQTAPYRLDSGDFIDVRCAENPRLNATITVGQAGTIELKEPTGEVLAEVLARGLTTDELARRIATLLESKGMRQATVSVTLLQPRPQPVVLIGEVVRKEKPMLRQPTPLLDVLLEAGGVTENHGGVVRVRRRASNGLSDEIEIALEDLIDRGDPTVNLPVHPGDVIQVPPARELRYYLVGEIEDTGAHTFRSTEEMTLLKAIAQAGGLGDNASRKVRIHRQAGDGKLVEIIVDFRRILQRKDPDVPLQDGDIIEVKEAFF
ncbi:MAG: hypothetical protein D6696_16210 [Acidobacteria bacterium]|nr:MAG: hypothetical protein D6696_16210 [Acidobacteriota bacterium]